MKSVGWPGKKLIWVLFILFFFAGCNMYFQTTRDQMVVHPEEHSVSRGRNLAFIICAGCHYDPSVKKFRGRPLNDLPRIAGQLYSANLTHSLTNGIPPHYSDAELFYLLKTGISRTGEFMPYMMRPTMADEDAEDIIAFLRSNDASLEAADTTIGITRINFIGKTGLRIIASPQVYNKGVSRPDETNAKEYGRYLVGIVGCYHCHSGTALGLNYADPEKSKKYLQGGQKLKDAKGKKIISADITGNPSTGIGSFSEEDFRKAVKEGIDPSGRHLSPPMPRFDSLTNNQAHALFAYLMTIR
ncbi:MAG: c-type cytochrome [Flavisolibacter sp.]